MKRPDLPVGIVTASIIGALIWMAILGWLV